MLSVYKKELRIFFVTMPRYIFMAIILLAIGACSIGYNFITGHSNYAEVLSFISLFFVFSVPLLTMRAFSEEKRQRTDQLLFSLPLNSRQIVLGKYLALLTIMAIPILIMSAYPLVLTLYGIIDLKTAYSSIIALYFLGGTLCAIGMFLSSLTENQLISAILSFGIFFLCYQASSISSFFSPSSLASYRAFLMIIIIFGIFVLYMTRNALVALICTVALEIPIFIIYKFNTEGLAGKFTNILEQLAVFDKMTNFVNGIFDITVLVYYASVAILFLFFSIMALEKKRWS